MKPCLLPGFVVFRRRYYLGIGFQRQLHDFIGTAGNAEAATDAFGLIDHRDAILHCASPHLAAVLADTTAGALIGIYNGKVIGPGHGMLDAELCYST
jgi:hypothetical protein